MIGVERERADRLHRLLIEDGREGRAAVGRFPHAARSRADEQGGLARGFVAAGDRRDAAHFNARGTQRNVGEFDRVLGDVDRVIADAFEVGDRLEHRRDLAQFAGHRLLLPDQLDARALDPAAAVAAKESLGGTGVHAVAAQIDWLEERARALSAKADAHGSIDALARRVFAEPLELP